MDYLNQISANNTQPQKQAFGGLFSKKFIYIIGGILVLTILVMILGGILSSAGKKDKVLFERINIRINNLSSITQEYGKVTKSSILRSMNASLYSVLNSASSNLSPLITSTYGIEADNPSSKISEEETAHYDSLKTTLDHAKLNGLLDRTYPHEMTYQIQLLLSLELEAIQIVKDENIKNVLNDNYTNLSSIYNKFSEYSDASSNVRTTN